MGIPPRVFFILKMRGVDIDSSGETNWKIDKK